MSVGVEVPAGASTRMKANRERGVGPFWRNEAGV